MQKNDNSSIALYWLNNWDYAKYLILEQEIVFVMLDDISGMNGSIMADKNVLLLVRSGYKKG